MNLIPIFDPIRSLQDGLEGISEILVTTYGSSRIYDANGDFVHIKAQNGRVDTVGARYHRAIAKTIVIYERYKGGVVIIRIKGMSFLLKDHNKGQNFQVMITSLKVMMTEVERRYPNIPLGWAFKGETHANVENLKADGHGFVMLRAGTSESVIEAIIQLMQKVLERQGSASRVTSSRDRTLIVWP